MSITFKGVKIDRKQRGKFFLALLGLVEVILSVLLVVSLSANLLFPQQTQAQPGVPQRLSYQGRLTDLSGNPLGGATGTNYCFRFSIFNAPTGGTQLWPQGAATPTSVTVRVKDGVFNTQVADSTGSLSWGFEDEKNIYLKVEINATPTTCGGSWEVLDLRQRIESVAFARVSEYLYSDLAKVASGSGELQLGFGTGSVTPVFLSLDWKSLDETVGASCTNNGSVWYNSADTKARVCQGSVIRDMIDGLLVQEEGADVGRASVALDFRGANVTASNVGGGVIQISVGGGAGIGGFAVNALTTYTSGTVVISAGANITLGTAGQTITISAPNPGGGAGATVSHWPPFMIGLATSSNYTGATAAGTNITATFHVAPLQLPAALSFSRINVVASYVTTIAGTGSVSLAHMLGIYTLNAGTALSLSTSYMFRQEISQNSITAGTYRWYWGTNSTSNSSSISGNVGSLFNSLRNIPLFDAAAGGSLSAGQYYMVYAQTNRSSSVNVKPAASIMFVSGSQSNLIGNQLGSVTTNTPFPLLGYFSSTTAVGNFTSPFMPSSINTTALSYSTSQLKWPFVNFKGK